MSFSSCLGGSRQWSESWVLLFSEICLWTSRAPPANDPAPSKPVRITAFWWISSTCGSPTHFYFLILRRADICNCYKTSAELCTISCAHLPTVLIHEQQLRVPERVLYNQRKSPSHSLQPPKLSGLGPFTDWASRPWLFLSLFPCAWEGSPGHSLCSLVSPAVPQELPVTQLPAPSCTTQHYSPNRQAHPVPLSNEKKRPKGILMGSFIPFIVLKQSYSDRLLEEFLLALEDQLQWRDD